MNINLSLSAAPGIVANYLVVAVYNSTAPATVVASQAFAAPHAAPRNLTFTGLNPTVYIVKTFESPDGSPSGVVRHQFIYNPTYGTAVIRIDEVLIAGDPGTPLMVPGTNTYVDAGLDGWEYTIERRGSGTMINQDIKPAFAEVAYIAGGGFELVVAGDQFGNGEIFILHFLPIISNVAPVISQTAGIIWSEYVDITGNTTLTAASMGKMHVIAGAGPVLDLLLPGGDEVVDGTLIGFMSEGGVHLACNLKPKGTDQLKWIGDTWTNADPFTICQAEEVWLAYHGGAWRVPMADGGWRTVGQKVFTYSKLDVNLIQADGNIYNRAYYPRLYRWINKFLAGGMMVNDATWLFRQDSTLNGNPYHFYPNVGKFSTGNLVNTFRMCLLYRKLDDNNNLMAGGYLRGVDGAAEFAGTQNIDGVGNFAADMYGKIIGIQFVNAVPNKVLVLDNFGNGGLADYGGGVTLNVPFAGKNPLTGVLNGETKPFTTNAYLYLRF